MQHVYQDKILEGENTKGTKYQRDKIPHYAKDELCCTKEKNVSILIRLTKRD